jgi:hypothetical protein
MSRSTAAPALRSAPPPCGIGVLLDHAAGLRAAALPTCSECKQGNEPPNFGEVVSFAILNEAATGERQAAANT